MLSTVGQHRSLTLNAAFQPKLYFWAFEIRSHTSTGIKRQALMHFISLIHFFIGIQHAQDELQRALYVIYMRRNQAELDPQLAWEVADFQQQVRKYCIPPKLSLS